MKADNCENKYTCDRCKKDIYGKDVPSKLCEQVLQTDGACDPTSSYTEEMFAPNGNLQKMLKQGIATVHSSSGKVIDAFTTEELDAGMMYVIPLWSANVLPDIAKKAVETMEQMKTITQQTTLPKEVQLDQTKELFTAFKNWLKLKSTRDSIKKVKISQHKKSTVQ